MKNSLHKDSIIILAWPQTPVSSVGMWYDTVTKFLGLLKNDRYKAGHAAAVLVNHKTKKLHYFDFGRYHMPQKFGRVRDEQSDPQLKITVKANLSAEDKLLNISEILRIVNSNKECHGQGVLYASALENISFEKAYKFAKDLQNSDAINYGPYDLNGSNCSRFIASLAIAGNPEFDIRFRLKFPILLTPLPKGNVIICNTEYYSVKGSEIKKHKVKFSDYLRNFVFPGFRKPDLSFGKKDTSINKVHNIKIHA
ncbi:MAG: hypothetical protein L3J56_07750 [Bacteroidales bacterium]|nr:hypothetical protein [Bacteroidales bacterium]